MSKQDNTAARILLSVALIAVAMAASYALLHAGVPGPCMCQPAPMPAPCCKADECRKELALVDTRFGDVWDELVEVQEQLAKLKPCGCGPVKECSCEPSKPCACSDKPACECKPAAPEPKVLLPTYRKRCR